MGLDAHRAQCWPLPPSLCPGPSAACQTSQVKAPGLPGEGSSGNPPEAGATYAALGLRPLPEALLSPKQGGSAQEALGELIPTSHPEPILILSPGLSCALWSYSVPARPPPSSRKLKGHPARPRPSPEPCESSVFPGPPTCQGLWALSHLWAQGAQPLLMDPALPPWSAGAPEPHPSSPGSVTLKPWSPGLSSSSSSDSVWPLGKPDSLLARGCGLDLFNRYCSHLRQGGAGGLVRIPREG